jgi:L-ascorbate metabolism protein UlaG (beta-lactamase superfamily)
VIKPKTARSEPKDWFYYSGLSSLSPDELNRNVVNLGGLNSRSVVEPTITWLGHASFLIFWAGKTILIDPVFANRIGGMPRRIGVTKEVYSIKPDVILISHAHMDHLDEATLKRYPQATIILPEKTENFLGNSIRNTVIPIGNEDNFSLGSLVIKTVPAKHGGWRYPWQQGYRAVGFLISQSNTSIYFAGDTAFGDHFAQIGKENTVETALLPIGAYSPRWFLKSRHLNPPEAVAAAKLLKAKTVIPFHFGTYRLSLDPVEKAFPWFVKEAAKKNIQWQLNYNHSLFKTGLSQSEK